ncbi:tail fiber protein [Shigella phage vB_SdyM_006]|nr:tail fiber protein [Shigella phage vB_SdyM_006]
MKLTEERKAKLTALIKTLLHNGKNEIVFTKKDGSIRVIRCTLDYDIIPEEHHPKQDSSKPLTEKETKTPSYIRVFDTEINAWRSITTESIISVNSMKYEDILRLV